MQIGGVEIPKELEFEARTLRRQCRWRMVKWMVYVALSMCVIAVFQSLITFAPSTGSGPTTLRIVGAGFSALCVMFAVQRVRTATAMDRDNFFRRHGYCFCGYKAMPSPDGGILSCPECGAAWRRELTTLP